MIPSMQSLLKSVMIPAMVIFGSAACGGSKQQVTTSAPGTSSLTSTNCTKSKCEPADMDVAANFAGEGVLVGFVGETVTWQFNGIDKATQEAGTLTSNRKVVVLLNNIPKGSSVYPAKGAALAAEARIDWVPTKKSRGTMEFIARDYERCILNKSKDYCNNYTFLKEYDKRFGDKRWEILDKDETLAAGDSVNVSDEECGDPTTKSDIGKSVLKIGLQVLMGGGVGAIIPTLAGSVLDSATQTPTDPTEC